MDKRSDPDLVRQVARTLPTLLARHGLHAQVRAGGADAPLHGADLLVDVEGEGIRFALAVDVRTRFDESALAEQSPRSDGVRLLLVPRLGRTTRERLRERRCNHADLAGSLFLRAPGVLVDVDGRRSIEMVPLKASKQQINPFSKKASLVARILCEQHGEPLSTAELVARSGLSRAWVFAVTQVLAERGYATSNEQGCRLSHPVELLRDWMAAYSWRRNPSREYELPFAHDELPDRLSRAFAGAEVTWALTLLSAAQRRIGYVESQGPLQLYAMGHSSGSIQDALDAVYAVPVNGSGNLVLMSPPYYRQAVFVGLHRKANCPLVSDVQLLLDLARYPVRGPETAEMLIRHRLAKTLSLSAADVMRLVESIA